MAASLKVFWEDPYLDPYSSKNISLGLGVLRPTTRCPQGLPLLHTVTVLLLLSIFTLVVAELQHSLYLVRFS